MATVAEKPAVTTRSYEPLFVDQDSLESLRVAAEASRLTQDDPGLRYAATLTAQRYTNTWRAAETPEAREAAWFAQRALMDVLAALEDIIEGYDVARKAADAKKQASA